jgi:hypothetical protein
LCNLLGTCSGRWEDGERARAAELPGAGDEEPNNGCQEEEDSEGGREPICHWDIAVTKTHRSSLLRNRSAPMIMANPAPIILATATAATLDSAAYGLSVITGREVSQRRKLPSRRIG